MRIVGIILIMGMWFLLAGCTCIPVEYTEYYDSGQVKIHATGTYIRFITKQEILYNPSTGMFEVRVSTDGEPILKALDTGMRLGAAGATIAP